MAAVGGEHVVIRSQRGRHSGRNCLLADRQMTGAFDQVLEEQVVRLFFEITDADLGTVHLEP